MTRFVSQTSFARCLVATRDSVDDTITCDTCAPSTLGPAQPVQSWMRGV